MDSTDTSTSTTDSMRRAAIDQSVRAPVLFFFANSAMWLLAATVMGLVATIKLYAPSFLDASWLWFLNYSRLQPAHINAFIYGWAMQAGLGASIWLMARRCGVIMEKGAGTLFIACIFWNIAVTLGELGIIFGGGSAPFEFIFGSATAYQWLEYPKFVWPVLLLAFLLVAWKLYGMFANARKEVVFTITPWYILGACLWFPWIYMTTNLLLNHYAQHYPLGAMGAGVNSWYVSTLIFLFFVPVGLGTCYYFIPKITGQAIASYQLAQVGFWTLAALGGWVGFQKYMGGPLPSWMPAVGGAALLLMVAPAGMVGLNHHLTTRGRHGMIQTSPTLRFVFVGSFCYVLMSGLAAIVGTFWAGGLLQFTMAEYGWHLLALYGFFSMTMFGAIYYIVPRLTGCEWLSVRLIRNHFWFSVYGISALVICMTIGGLAQGWSMNAPINWDSTFAGVVTDSRGYLVGRTLAWVLILWSNTWFFIHLLFMVAGLGRRGVEPTLLVHDSHHDYVPGTLLSVTTTAK
jgi:cytochrome c oxidase cbb3-type subunit 1